MDLTTGEQRVLGNFNGFDPGTMALTSDDREAVLLDGAMLIAVQVANQRRRELARMRDGWTMRGTVAMSEDGTHLFFAEAREERSELRRLRLPKGGPETIIEQPGGIVERIRIRGAPRCYGGRKMASCGLPALMGQAGGGWRRLPDGCWMPTGPRTGSPSSI